MELKPDLFAKFVMDEFGIAMTSAMTARPEGQSVELRPIGVPRSQGFKIEFIFGWRSLKAEFGLGAYAQELAARIANAPPEQQTAFRSFLGLIRSNGGEARIRAAGVELQSDLATWPSSAAIEFSLWKTGVMVADGVLQPDAVTWLRRFIGLSLALLPLESETEPAALAEEEGRQVVAYVKRYERSRVNRALCIDEHGVKCAVCAFDFESAYGPIGRGYIHVHHLEPVSMMGGSYVLDPINDLRPVCPNCHAMLHRRKPPFSINELRVIAKKEDPE